MSDKKELLKQIPKMDELLLNDKTREAIVYYGKNTMTDALRGAVEAIRTEILSGGADAPNAERIIKHAIKLAKTNSRMNLRKVINATGTILHTNLGRAKLSASACEAVMDVAKNYSNLEYNIEEGKRGERYDAVSDLLRELTGAESSLVVNNNAAAVLLALSALAKEKRVIVSRGEQVEIGGMFRVPEIMNQSNSILVEVGCTNKTHYSDYEAAIDENSVLLKVHTSNYKIIGFTEEVELKSLVELGKKHDIPVIYDMGSGSFVDFSAYGTHGEPTVRKCVDDGADVVTFSGDKLLGGPQAGIILGSKEYIDIMKKHPLTRAFRVDKMTIAALEATLREYLEEGRAIKNIPVLNQITSNKDDVKKKAKKLHKMIMGKYKDAKVSLIEDKATIGGGSMPGQFIDTYCLQISPGKLSVNEMEKALRMLEIPIVARIANDTLVLDMLTVDEADFAYIAGSVSEILC